jgi:hypothetical protein
VPSERSASRYPENAAVVEQGDGHATARGDGARLLERRIEQPRSRRSTSAVTKRDLAEVEMRETHVQSPFPIARFISEVRAANGGAVRRLPGRFTSFQGFD